MLILYVGDLHFSGWSMRGRIALQEKRLPFEERRIELDWPTTETPDGVLIVGDIAEEREAQVGCQCRFTDLQLLDTEKVLAGSVAKLLPRVPILVDTSTRAVATDVVSIAEYLDELAPESGVRLTGATLAQRAVIRSVCAWATHDLSLLMNGPTYAKAIRPQRPSQPDQGAVEQAHWVCDTVAALLDNSGGPFVVGEFSLADVLLSTYFQQIIGWRIEIGDNNVGQYAQRLLRRPSVRDHLYEATAIYRAIDEAEAGSPLWILRHYRYNRELKLLHDWQTDRCVRVSNATAERVVDLAYDGQDVEAIAAIVAAEHQAPLAQVRADVRGLLDQLTPLSVSRAA